MTGGIFRLFRSADIQELLKKGELGFEEAKVCLIYTGKNRKGSRFGQQRGIDRKDFHGTSIP
jgi:hypothetical protein